ncbi:sec-independent protein translocase protein TatB [Jatrophihabitans sp. GAS493]|uniref:sec-independent translocase n=1 Tax=Jatrophihabitans sp. GAS493 TaxID=1907575 RepID=UPI000BB7AD0C|nr:sec-independent translocase [Jatrophihabitans sp. GAS493]SOD73028.1 sec-independent protein translocase protein TatB [Jatrophihabitans sp. GAS493]
MFNIGPLELVVLGFVALIVIGPEKLPQHARDAARMIRSLREMANGARGQFRDELGPDLADLNLDALRELRSLNPRSALMKALFDETDSTAGEVVAEKPQTAPTSSAPLSSPPLPPSLEKGEIAPFDDDAT